MQGGLELLAQLSELDVDWLLTAGRAEHLPTGATLIKKGETDTGLILLLDGEARVFDPKSEKEFARIGMGELLGEISFIDKKGATAAVATVKPSSIFRIPKRQLEDKLARDPVFASRFYHVISGFLSSRLRSVVAPEEPKSDEGPEVLEAESLGRARLARLLNRLTRRDAVILNGQDLTIEQVVDVAIGKRLVELSSSANAQLVRSRAIVEKLATTDRSIYGLNTGVGALKEFRIPPSDIERFQKNILRSHAVGIPPAYPQAVCRAIMLARLNGMARGGAGISPEVFNRLLHLLNTGVTPVILSRGSVGMADLSPLAHMSLPLIGEGEVWFEGTQMPAAAALAKLGLEPVPLRAKDGLSLVSANSAAIGHGALVLSRFINLLFHADCAAALSIDAFLANPSPLDERILSVRPHQGQVMTTLRLRALLEGSSCHDPKFRRTLQDPISFRCIPQVHGPLQESLALARRVIEMELNSTGDNPVVAPDISDIISNGNFHPAGFTVALETLSNAIAHLASISASRTLRLNDASMTGLPSQLIACPGLNTGFGVTQKSVTMLNAHVRYLAAPASLDFMAVANSIEDHSTMATAVVSKLEDQIETTEQILGIEMLTAAQAINMREGTTLGRGTSAIHRELRQRVPFMEEDRNISTDIATVCAMIRDGSLVAAIARLGAIPADISGN